MKYFASLEEDDILKIAASAAFVKEHGQQVIDSIVTLEGSYPFCHKLQGKIADLSINFKVVSEGMFGPQTAAALQDLKTEV